LFCTGIDTFARDAYRGDMKNWLNDPEMLEWLKQGTKLALAKANRTGNTHRITIKAGTVKLEELPRGGHPGGYAGTLDVVSGMDGFDLAFGLARAIYTSDAPELTLNAAEKQLCVENNIIGAIKACRERVRQDTGETPSLVTIKNLVDRFVETREFSQLKHQWDFRQ
jgi:hypothetical protein